MTDYRKIYSDKWRVAYANNTVNDDGDSCVELHWRGIPLGEMFCDPKGVVFTKLYRFMGDPELIKIQSFPAAENEFNALLKNVEKLEYICQLYEVVEAHNREVDLYRNNMMYGRILFLNGEVTFEGNTSNGWKTTSNPDVMINHAKYIKDSGRKLEIFDDLDLIKDLGNMLRL